MEQWKLLSVGNSFSCGLGGEGVRNLWLLEERSDFSDEMWQEGGGILCQNRVASFMDDPQLRIPLITHVNCSIIFRTLSVIVINGEEHKMCLI